MGFFRSRERLLGMALLALVAALVFGLGTVGAQADIECACGTAGCPVDPLVGLTKIDNIKKPDLVIVNNNPGDDYAVRANKFWNKNPAVNVVKVNDLQGAISIIIAVYLGNGATKLNVVIADHGASGEQNIGKKPLANPDANTIGAKNAKQIANQQKFTQAVAGKIEHLTLLGCSVAAPPNGQAFLDKLRNDIGADGVKAFTGPVGLSRNAPPPLPAPLVPNNYYVKDGVKVVKGSVGGIAELPEIARAPLETDGSSGVGAGVLAGAIAGAVLVGGVTLGGAAWYARRRWLR